ncbi:hypothetical protein AAVH_02154 [Aphelenchoides avenae]|nr:hypothetical protein AAVH_02154 [Aphelenchus avenae]
MGFTSSHFVLAALTELGCSVFSTLVVIAMTTLIIVNCRKKKEKKAPLDLNKILVDANKPDAQSMYGVDTEEHFPGLHDAMLKE